jgi:uncharacterized protein YndB with AHSA1/START domain
MNAHTDFIRISRPANEVFAFMSDHTKLSLWSFGTWKTEFIPETGIVRGWSMKDGSKIYLKIQPYKDIGLIDYLLGPEPDALVARIFVRIVAGSNLGGIDDECGLTMTALRTKDMDDLRWNSLIAAHVVELDLIKSAIETGYDHRNPHT